MVKRDFEILCLIKAATSDFDISRGDLILMASGIDAAEFMSVYSEFEMMTEAQVSGVMAEYKENFVRNAAMREELMLDIRRMFFADRKTMHLEEKMMKAIGELF